MRFRQSTVSVLNKVQMFDQQIAPARPVAEHLRHVVAGPLLDLTPTLKAPPFPAAAWVSSAEGQRVHCQSSMRRSFGYSIA